jgi:hypothetical protein
MPSPFNINNCFFQVYQHRPRQTYSHYTLFDIYNFYDDSTLSHENNISKHIKTKLQFTQVSDFSFASVNHLTSKGHFSGRTAPLTYRRCIFLFIQQIYVLNILNMLYTLRFFLFKMLFIS